MKRLTAIAELIGSAECVADIGYDHGWLLQYLLRSRPQLRVVGVELQAVCADRFLTRYGYRIHGDKERLTLVHGDGLHALQPDQAEVVVICGIGEYAIIRMLDQAPDQLASCRRLILCPANFRAALRQELAARGWRVVAETIVEEAGQWFSPCALERGPEHCADPIARRLAPRLFEAHPVPPELLAWLRHLQRQMRKATRAFRQHPEAGSPDLRIVLLGLDEVIARLEARSLIP